MATLRQIRSVVAVYEEGSFTGAAQRENATQSGISQHVAALEAEFGVKLFSRGVDGVQPTPAGRRYYARAIEALRNLAAAEVEARDAATALAGPVDAGLMPTFTRAATAPALARVAESHPAVSVRVVEGYSAALTEMVRAGELDFALVPAFAADEGLTVSHLARDREMLVSGAAAGLAHGEPVRPADLPPLKLVVPGRANVRRTKVEEYLAAHGGRIARLMEMDSMMGTLELVALSDWVAILPGLVCGPDDGRVRRVSPLADPPLHSDFVAIEPARRPLSPQAALLLEALRAEIAARATR